MLEPILIEQDSSLFSSSVPRLPKTVTRMKLDGLFFTLVYRDELQPETLKMYGEAGYEMYFRDPASGSLLLSSNHSDQQLYAAGEFLCIAAVPWKKSLGSVSH